MHLQRSKNSSSFLAIFEAIGKKLYKYAMNSSRCSISKYLISALFAQRLQTILNHAYQIMVNLCANCWHWIENNVNCMKWKTTRPNSDCSACRWRIEKHFQWFAYYFERKKPFLTSIQWIFCFVCFVVDINLVLNVPLFILRHSNNNFNSW